MPLPFGLPWPTAWYVSLYLGTLVLHVLFMNYVLAGSAYLVGAGVARLRGETDDPLCGLLREWLPFMLSGAITAGVAPLLFVQILYQREFYTANLLLFHRWMAILPALIVGFYALYLLKNWPARARTGLRMVTAMVTFACFAFVGWSWTENHLLSLQSQQVWVDQYVSRSLVYRTSQLLPRLGIWFCGSFSVLALWLSWQLWWPHGPGASRQIAGTHRTAAIALGGLASASLFALWYLFTLTDAQRAAVFGPGGLWLALAVIGVCVQGYLWWGQYREVELCPRHLTALSVASVLTVTGVAVTREAIRLEAVDLAQLAEQHRQASAVGGLGVFVVFLVINTALIGYCIRLVCRDEATPEA